MGSEMCIRDRAVARPRPASAVPGIRDRPRPAHHRMALSGSPACRGLSGLRQLQRPLGPHVRSRPPSRRVPMSGGSPSRQPARLAGRARGRHRDGVPPVRRYAGRHRQRHRRRRIHWLRLPRGSRPTSRISRHHGRYRSQTRNVPPAPTTAGAGRIVKSGPTRHVRLGSVSVSGDRTAQHVQLRYG